MQGRCLVALGCQVSYAAVPCVQVWCCCGPTDVVSASSYEQKGIVKYKSAQLLLVKPHVRAGRCQHVVIRRDDAAQARNLGNSWAETLAELSGCIKDPVRAII